MPTFLFAQALKLPQFRQKSPPAQCCRLSYSKYAYFTGGTTFPDAVF
jgi:hypothetical protein